MSSDLYLHAMLPKLGSLLTEDGMLLAAVPSSQKYGFEHQGFTIIQGQQQSTDDCVILARRSFHDQGCADTVFVVSFEDFTCSFSLEATLLRSSEGRPNPQPLLTVMV